MTDEEFEEDAAMVANDLALLKQVLEGGPAVLSIPPRGQ